MRLRSFWKKCPLILLLLASALLFESVGLVLQGRVPERRRADGVQTPYLTGVFLYLSGERALPEETTHAPVAVKPVDTQLAKPELVRPKAVVTTVEDSYFDDALFIGDSRISDMELFSGLNNASYFAKVGMSVYKLFTDAFIRLDGVEGELTLEQALAQRRFGKIYLMVGINELGTGDEARFIAAYQEAVARIRALQPDAVFYIMGILSVTRELADVDKYVTLDAIRTRNADLEALADGEHIFLCGCQPDLCRRGGIPDGGIRRRRLPPEREVLPGVGGLSPRQRSGIPVRLMRIRAAFGVNGGCPALYPAKKGKRRKNAIDKAGIW